MINFRYFKRLWGSQGGAFVPLIAGFTVCLLIMTAFITDVSFLYLAKKRWERTIQASCVGALEQYFMTAEITDSSDPFANKREAARRRAQALIGLNNLEFRALTSGDSDQLQNEIARRDLSNASAENGFIEFGRWNFEERDFHRIESLEDTVFAIRIRVNLSPHSPLKGYFGGLTGRSGFLFNAESACSVTPRHMLVAVDLSRSIVSMTHRPWEAGPGIPAGELPTRSTVTDYGPAEYFYPVNVRYDSDSLQDFRIFGVGPSEIFKNPCLPRTCAAHRFCTTDQVGDDNIVLESNSIGPVNPCQVAPILPFEPGSACLNPPPAEMVASDDDDSIYPMCPLAWTAGPITDETPGIIYHHMRAKRNWGTDEQQDDTSVHFMDDYGSLVTLMRRCESYGSVRRCYQACRDKQTHEELFDCLSEDPACRNPSFLGCLSNNPMGLMDYSWASNVMRGPEPLFGILRGVNALLASFEERAVVGDLIGLSGFDSVPFYPQRLIELSPPERPAPPLERTNFGDMAELTNVASAQTSIVDREKLYNQVVKRAFFPVGASGTNVPLALRNGLMMLVDAPGGSEAEASIIVVSDFISTCYDGTAGVVTEPPGDATPFCGRGASFYENAQLELSNIVEDYLVPQGVRVHAVAVGAHIAPHTLLVRGASGCMDSREARMTHTENFVDPIDPNAPPDSLDQQLQNRFVTPFVRANEFYSRVVAPTGGMWMPLRPSCCNFYSGAGTCDNTRLMQLRESMNSACNEMPLEGQRLSLDKISQLQAQLSDFYAGSVVDGQGRLLCDPNGQSLADQVTSYMQTLMQDNTFYTTN